MIAKLLDENGDVDGRVEAGRGIKGFLEQDIDVPGFAGDRVGTGLVRRKFTVIAGQVVEQCTHLAQTRHLVLDHEIGHAALAVNRRAAQFVGGDILAQYRFHHARAGQAEKRLVGLDQETALARQV